MFISLTHETIYQYDKSVNLSNHMIRLRPAPYCKLPIKSYTLNISPHKHFINWHYDPVGNHIANVNFLESTKALRITVDLIVERISLNPFDFFVDSDAITYPFSYQPTTLQILQPYLQFKYSERLFAWFNRNNPNTEKTLDFLVSLNKKIHEFFKYQLRLTPGVQNPEETLHLRIGSCRDLAWFECILLRHLGFATRFVSGYLLQLIDINENPNVTEDSLELHAWTEVFIPGAGWVGFDPTSGLLTADNHIPLCASADPAGAAAISGSVSQCNALFDYKMSIKRLSTSSRTHNNPLSDEQWEKINKIGSQIDHCLTNNNIQLTIGGEPTYVKKNHLDDPQWQTAALGLEKFTLGQKVNHDLQTIFAPNGFSILTQGKWYPGEVLPRWAFYTYWRKDNQPLWCNHDLLKKTPDKNLSNQHAKKFIQLLGKKLCINPKCIKPVFEDKIYQLWLIGKLGKHINIENFDLKTPDDQSLVKKLYQDNLTEETGYCLPIHWHVDKKNWLSCNWQTKANKITAIPGESSLGYRLPLDKLASEFKTEIDDNPESSGFEEHNLPTYDNLLDQLQTRQQHSTPHNQFIRTALSVEIRNSCLYVFIPPIKPLHAYCELLIAIELTATKLNFPIQLEGYRPPTENKLNTFSVTPDPGVLEINVHPAQNWQELVSIQHTLLDITSKHGLIAHKYSLDGRKIATGGGCHITLGGPTPSASPFLKQPELLQSMLTFWQHHPSLSYLFSGLFIGPTSQAPRIDEARHDSLYELELAFAAMPKGSTENFWLIDRLLRHLLVDVTGNTHRAEFCIDKLFSPDHECGRQGLVELRAFEMQSHPQLNCLQQLLVKTLVTIFTEQNYHHKLTRWGTELHDRFMLPYFIWYDFNKINDYINAHGIEFDSSWFSPIFDFRFQTIGTTVIQDIHIELRHALECWPVLGEEFQQNHVSRLVDSTLARIQVLCTGINLEKYALTCNGITIPLQKTHVSGQYVAGIRFKAWDFIDCLHPNLSALQSLTFDLVDLQLKRSLGGCLYYNQHPGGKNPAQIPINQREAETRQRARFQPLGHTPGHIQPIELLANPEYPYTLDLRQTVQQRVKG